MIHIPVTNLDVVKGRTPACVNCLDPSSNERTIDKQGLLSCILAYRKREQPIILGMTPGIHGTRHGPHYQRWSSPQDQGVRRTALVGVHRKATIRYCNTK